MRNLSLIVLLLGSFNSFADDIICANKAARQYGARVLNAQLLQHKQTAVNGDEVFAQKVIVADEVMIIQPMLNTVGDLQAAIFATKEFKKMNDVGGAIVWTLYRNLPKTVQAETLLTEVFCK